MKQILLALLILGALVACSNGSKGGGGGGGGDGSGEGLSYSPTTIDFGNVAKEIESDVMGINIKNASSSDVVINSFSISAPFIRDSNSTCDTGIVLKKDESCIFDIAVQSDTLGGVTGVFSINTNAGNFQTTLNAMIVQEVSGVFITKTDYPAYNARLAVTAEGTIYAVDDNLLVLRYDKTANRWSPVKVRNNEVSGFSLEGYSVSVAGGKIYVIGGLKNGSAASNGVLEFNPANRQWKDITPSNYDYRSAFHTATTVNGKIYVIGGAGIFTPTGPLDKTNFTGVIDPANRTYRRLSSNGFTDRAAHAATAINNKIYVFAGMNEAGNYLNGVYAFDTETETWTPVLPDDDPNLNINPREDAAMTSIGDNLYVFGGRDGGGNTFGDFKIFSVINVSDWTDFLNPLDKIVQPTTRATVVSTDNNIYAFGGVGNGEFKKTFWRYNRDLALFDNLTSKDTLTPLENSASVGVGSDVYLLGGEKYAGFSEEFTKFNLFERTGLDINPEGRIISPYRGISTATDGRFIYIFGGQDKDSTPKYDFYIYNIAAGRYEQLDPIDPTSRYPSPRFGAASAVVNGKLYVIGGRKSDNTAPLDDTWFYDRSSNAWSDITSSDTNFRIAPLTSHSATVIGTKIYVIGGLTIGNEVQKRIYVMDTSATPPRWEHVVGGDMPKALFSHSAAAIGENIYVFSGQEIINSAAYSNILLKYNIRDNNWTEISLPNMPYSYDSGYKLYNNNGTLWFLNNSKFDLRYYRPL